MRTTPQLLDAMKKHLGLPSDYALGKHLGESHTRISNYRTGTSKFDEGMCLRAAEILGEPAGVILAEIASERAKRPDVKRAWQRAAAALTAGATALFLFVIYAGYLPAETLEIAFFIPALEIHIIRSH